MDFMRLVSEDICGTFRHLAVRTWDYSQYSIRANISVGEESYTDINLLDLATLCPTTTTVYKFSRKEEGNISGADWVWWFVNSNLSKRAIIAVQAKKLNLRTHKYTHVNYPRNTSSQLKTLLNYASQIGATPMYCFYNYFSPTSPNANLATSPYYGCTLVSAHFMCQLTTTARAIPSDVHPGAHPWHHLVCPASPPHAGTDIVDIVRGTLQSIWGIDQTAPAEIDQRSIPNWVRQAVARQPLTIPANPEFSYGIVTVQG